jgi:hypothetical protein
LRDFPSFLGRAFVQLSDGFSLVSRKSLETQIRRLCLPISARQSLGFRHSQAEPGNEKNDKKHPIILYNKN